MDKLAGWLGAVGPSQVYGAEEGAFAKAKRSGQGALILTAHIGNPDVLRAVGSLARGFRVNVLAHTRNAERFNRVLARAAPASPVRLVQVSEIDLGAAMRLAAAIEGGEWVVMTADRLPPHGRDAAVATVTFLGGRARLPTGPWVLASALKCPVYTLFCTPRGRGYELDFRLFAERLDLPRGERTEGLSDCAQRFALLMESAVARAPLQWFNFYDFWTERADSFGDRSPAPSGVAGGETREAR